MGSDPGAWLAAQSFSTERVIPLSGDVSARRYFRVFSRDGRSAILSQYPQGLSGAYSNFAATTALLQEAGIRVPTILALDPTKIWMLLEDLGEKNLFEEAATHPDQEPYFRSATALIEVFRSLPRDVVASRNPPLDTGALTSELDQTWKVFLEPRGFIPSGNPGRDLRGFLRHLCHELGSRPLVPCHRDFMARNLMPLAGEETRLAVIDYQDLRLGPYYYDLASLLNDSFFPAAEEEKRLLDLAGVGEDELDLYHKTAVQRTLKAVGTFAAFAERGSDVHLPLIPPTLRRALYHLAALPEMGYLAAFLKSHWQAALNSFC